MRSILWLTSTLFLLGSCEKTDKATSSAPKQDFGTFGPIFSQIVRPSHTGDAVNGTRFRFRDEVTGKEGDFGLQVSSGPYLDAVFQVFDCNGTSGRVSYQIEFLFKDPNVIPDSVDPTPLTGVINCPKGREPATMNLEVAIAEGKFHIALKSYMNPSETAAIPPGTAPSQ